MRIDDQTRTRITVEMRLTVDPTGSEVELQVDEDWYPCAWLEDPVEDEGGVWTRTARTTTYFAGPEHEDPSGAEVLTIGVHPTQTKVTWLGGDEIVAHAGNIVVRS